MNSKETAGTPKIKHHRRVFGLLYIMLLLLSVIFIWHAWISSIEAIEHDAKAVAMAAKNTLDIESLSGLKGEASDVGGEPYESVKGKLVRFAEADDEIRFVYLFTLRGEEIVILADSEPPTSNDYSPPGQAYDEVDASYFKPFNSPNADIMITPINRDRWGSWKSVLVPLYAPDSGELTAVLGVDYPPRIWFMPAIIETARTFGFALAALCVAFALSALVKKNILLEGSHEEVLLAGIQAQEEKAKALQAQKEVEMHSEIQRILLDISSDFVSASPDSIDRAINSALEKVGKAVCADRVYIFKYDFPKQICFNTFEWCAEGITAQINNLQHVPLSLMNDWPQAHQKGKPVFIPNVSTMPADDTVRTLLEPQGVSSLLTVPMMLGGDCFGFIGFDSVGQYHIYTEKERHLLAQFSNLIISVLDKLLLYEVLSENEEKYRNIFEYSPVGVFNFDTDARIVDCNDFFVEIIGSSREALIGLNLLKLPDEKIVACIQGALKGDITEYRDVYHAVTSDKVTPIRGKFSPILSGSGEITGGTGIIEDITERKRLGDELRLKSLVLDQLEEHITITDLNGVITYVNRVQTDVLAYTPQEIVGKKTDVFGEDPAKGASQKEILEQTLANGSWQGEVVNYTSEGRELIMDCRTQVVSDEDGNPVALGGIAMDITERKIMEQALYNEKEQFRTTLLSVGDGVIATDAQGNVTVLNAVAEELTGWRQADASGKPLDEVFNIINEFTGDKMDNPVSKVLSSGEVFELSNHTLLLAPDGTGRYIEDSAAPIKNAQGNITGVVLVFRDVTDKKTKQQEIEFLSFHDQLTGLHNRRYYEQEVQRLDEEKYYPITLVMADVNGLKLTNDAFGHDAGDLLLQRIAEILKRECRSRDIVARIGGDEFVLLLPQTDAKNAETIIARINAAIAREKIDNLVLSISIGYAVKDDAAVGMNEIFMIAEDAMYRNKLSDSSSMRSKTIDLIMNSLFAKNEREMFHSERVGEICEAIAKEMGFAQVEVDQIRLAGLMHDIGKIGISEEVLNKQGKLKSHEWNEIERHSEIGYRILGSVNEFSKIADYILEHHERVDGKGYPRGLSDLEISLQAKIIAVADAYDAMMTDRPYRKALTKEQAIEQIKKYSGTQFDRNVAEIFVEMVLELKW